MILKKIKESFVSLLILICLVPLQSYAAPKSKKEVQLIGKDLSGSAFDLRNEVKKHKLTVVNFWETWCGPCKIELPDLEKMYVKNKDQNVLFVGIHHLSPLPKVKPIVDELKLTFPIIQDDTKKISEEFGVIGTPTTAVLDSNFKIIRRFEGIDTGLSDFISAQLKK